MERDNIREIALFEHHFWLQILGDHSRFILNALSPNETFFIDEANKSIDIFDNLLEESHNKISNEDISRLNYESYSAAMRIRKLKLSIIAKHIEGKINISLPPTFINHMVNELEEYIFILNDLINGKKPCYRDIHLHLLWLPDGSGHASTLADNLDMTEKKLIKKAKVYSKMFTNYYLKAKEFSGYTRTGIIEFPALKKLDADVDEAMNYFKDFLKKLEEYILEKQVLGVISPLTTDHMFREECYYLTKLSMVSDTKPPECDPTKPRIKV
ncbi:DUF2935 domain-containing protein [Clostridium saccharobutylicum]|uniref:DUF2935 domain-containing protein n=1 Tax=Clostridium saccharobutylicum TaxID=169679 RepID=A0A1S8NHZ5_CLOSA|nr:DUF2935 domain-containing protein [Clostridium saccharobutylicum]OOM16077.1 hypothetical protein CLOSAC_03480 [Clostridium saccharobutylicum]